MLIAEDLLLLLTDDRTGKLCVDAAEVDLALAGANLVELSLLNKVAVSPRDGDAKPGRLVVRDATPTGDPLLDAALEEVIADEGKKPVTAVRALAKHVRAQVYERLVASGALRAERARALGLIPRRTWPADDPHHEDEVRRSINVALSQRSTPDPHAAALIGLLHAMRRERRILNADQLGLSKDELKARIAAIADGDWASESVRKAIDAVLAAVIAATGAATSTVVLSGGT